MAECSVRECAKPAYAKRFCARHYQQYRRTGSPIRKPKLPVFKPTPAGKRVPFPETSRPSRVNINPDNLPLSPYHITCPHSDCKAWPRLACSTAYATNHSVRVDRWIKILAKPNLYRNRAL